MATFSERKVQAFKDGFNNLNTTELNEIRQFLQTYKPEKKNEVCGFLNLPPEIRNQIYHLVAEDAHTACAAPEEAGKGTVFLEIRCGNAQTLRDEDGNKIRPGLLGTCREIFKEFHGIFYSPAYIDVKLWQQKSQWQVVKSPALLDAVVNQKHDVTQYSRPTRTMEQVNSHARARGQYDYVVGGYLKLRLLSDTPIFVGYSFSLTAPWVDDFGVKADVWSMGHDCWTQGTSKRKVGKDEPCALCLVSVGLEQARKQQGRDGVHVHP